MSGTQRPSLRRKRDSKKLREHLADVLVPRKRRIRLGKRSIDLVESRPKWSDESGRRQQGSFGVGRPQLLADGPQRGAGILADRLGFLQGGLQIGGSERPAGVFVDERGELNRDGGDRLAGPAQVRADRRQMGAGIDLLTCRTDAGDEAQGRISRRPSMGVREIGLGLLELRGR